MLTNTSTWKIIVMSVPDINPACSILTSVQTGNNIMRINTATLAKVELIWMRSGWPGLAPFCQLEAKTLIGIKCSLSPESSGTETCPSRMQVMEGCPSLHWVSGSVQLQLQRNLIHWGCRRDPLHKSHLPLEGIPCWCLLGSSKKGASVFCSLPRVKCNDQTLALHSSPLDFNLYRCVMWPVICSSVARRAESKL